MPHRIELCPTCGGRMKVEMEPGSRQWEICPDCDGTGLADPDEPIFNPKPKEPQDED